MIGRFLPANYEQYITGLRSFLQEKIGFQTLWTFHEAQNMALKAKLLEKDKCTGSSTSGIEKSNYESSAPSVEKNNVCSRILGRVICKKNFPHLTKVVAEIREEIATKGAILMLAEATEDEDEEDNFDADYEGAEFANEDGDEMVNLVLQRVLLSPKQEAGQ
ncbi:unnamed protein product [Prunus brigantina]